MQKKSSYRKRIPQILFVFYCILLLLLSVLPLNGKSSPINHIFIVKIRLDYLLHAVVYLPWMSLIYFAFIQWGRKILTKKVVTWLIFGLCTAFFTEGVQYYLPYRSFNINDLIANFSGVLIGLFFFLFIVFIKKPIHDTRYGMH